MLASSLFLLLSLLSKLSVVSLCACVCVHSFRISGKGLFITRFMVTCISFSCTIFFFTLFGIFHKLLEGGHILLRSIHCYFGGNPAVVDINLKELNSRTWRSEGVLVPAGSQQLESQPSNIDLGGSMLSCMSQAQKCQVWNPEKSYSWDRIWGSRVRKVVGWVLVLWIG